MLEIKTNKETSPAAALERHCLSLWKYGVLRFISMAAFIYIFRRRSSNDATVLLRVFLMSLSMVLEMLLQ